MVPSTTLLARWFKKKVSTAMGIAVAASPLGGAILIPIINRINITIGWRGSFIFLGAIILFLIPIAYFMTVDYPENMGLHVDGEVSVKEEVKEEKIVRRTTREILSTRQVWLISTAYLLFAMCGFAVLMEIPTFAEYEIGLDSTTTAIAMAIMSGLGVITSLIWPMIADRTGRRKAVLSVELLMLAIAIALFSKTSSALSLIGFSAFFGMTYMGGFSLFPSIAVGTYGREGFGIVNGTLALFGGIGAGIGPLVAAYFSDVVGSYRIGWFVFALSLMLSIILILMVKPIKKVKT